MACIKTEDAPWEGGPAPHAPSNKTGQKNIIQIYTDWANHYLDKGKCKRHIQTLQNDVVDGVIISDVIEAVTGQKVADVNRRPKTRAQMLQNLDLCLAQLRSMGVAVDDVQSDDVIDGKLKPILGLFFQLSRHKQQQQKRKPRAEMAGQHAATKVPTGGKSGISCIPSARDRQTADTRPNNRCCKSPPRRPAVAPPAPPACPARAAAWPVRGRRSPLRGWRALPPPSPRRLPPAPPPRRRRPSPAWARRPAPPSPKTGAKPEQVATSSSELPAPVGSARPAPKNPIRLPTSMRRTPALWPRPRRQRGPRSRRRHGRPPRGTARCRGAAASARCYRRPSSGAPGFEPGQQLQWHARL
ncbi:neuron navigator 3-like [Pollicipes pollicipes]|uniref:neuron navigator 3-like n=1 Tax=Pollicipes pollicipes TaxID=41117 RepID=UPI00188595F9|nr:neuron navigator 3-like [Pollicipes pollicipes]